MKTNVISGCHCRHAKPSLMIPVNHIDSYRPFSVKFPSQMTNIVKRMLLIGPEGVLECMSYFLLCVSEVF